MDRLTRIIARYATMALMMAFIVTSLSCERDVFWLGDDGTAYNPRPVTITLGYELPQQEELAITRSMSKNEEHKLRNFYLLIFQCTTNNPNEDPACVFGNFFSVSDNNITNVTDYNALSGDWVSVEKTYNSTSGSTNYSYPEDAHVNSTHGEVTIDAEVDPDKPCYMFGFGNIDDVGDERVVAFVSDPTAETTTYLMPRAVLDKFADKNNNLKKSDLEALQIQLRNKESFEVTPQGEGGETLTKSEVVDRESAFLLYSGQWSTWTTKRVGEDGKTHNVFDANSLSGLVDLSSPGTSGNNYDLRSKGIIYLRCLISHINFEITVDNDVFEAFKPESWQVVNVPYNTYLIDKANSSTSRKITDKSVFAKSTPNTKMLHDEGVYSFDFYMFENIKDAVNATESGIDFSGYSGTDKNAIVSNYATDYGTTISDVPSGNTHNGFPALVNLLYGGDQDAFKYAKRELELKDSNGKLIMNTVSDGNRYESKKFVYSEPNATYVVIKGRLLLRDKNADGTPKDIDLKRLAGTYDMSNNITGTEYVNIGEVINGYADVTYTIHLGYTRPTPTSSSYNERDFNVLRNSEYTYKVNIVGINSIVTNVLSKIDKKQGDTSEQMSYVKKQPGADGRLNLAMNSIFNTDAHFNQFNFMLEKSGLSDFSFEINTPWSTITSDDVKADIDRVKVAMGLGTIVNGVFVPGDGYATGYGAFAGGGYKDQNSYPTAYAIYQKYITNPDFTWFKFTPAIDQRGMFDPVLSHDDNNTKYRKYRETVTYDPSSPTLWNLFDFMVSMDGLSASDDQQPLYNEGINQGTDTVEEYRRKIGTAIKTRINNVLYGNDAGTTEGSVTLFECEVNDDKGNNVYTGASALPFLLDKFKYEVTQQDYNFIKTIYDAVTADNSITINDDIYFNKFKRPYFEDGRYWVEEDYVQYLKEHDPAHFRNNNQIAPIRRMFYTAYLDEYFYDTPPTGQTWTKPYWKQFVNQPSRYINFGYSGSTDITSSIETMHSVDGETILMLSSTTIIQPSIQTFYSTEGTGTYALGVEHYNETYDPRWTDKKHTIGTSGLSHADGWANASAFILNVEGGGDWATYVSETVYEEHNSINGIQSNVTMRSSDDALMTEENRMGSGNNTAYLAGAIRMCMNRNRDENGNGKIDEEELKWYLPASEQMDIISMCHYSLADPLFNFNQFYANAPDANHQRLPEEKLKGKYLYKYHFATSDHYVFGAEEFMNSAPYNQVISDYNSFPFDMRCVRNLNDDDTDNNKPASKNVKTPSNAELVKVYTYDKTNKVFTMNKLDTRSLRNEIYVDHELPSPHYMFSRDNLPYKKFKVAKDNAKLLTIVNPPYLTAAERGPLNNIIDKSPCSNYSQDGDTHGWRAPNAAELGLMMMELRASGASEKDGYYEDIYDKDDQNNGVPAFFWNDGSAHPFSSTSWNFTGPWGRVLGVKYKDGRWKPFMSDPLGLDGDWSNKGLNEEFGISRFSSFIVRCVKDLAE